MPHFSPSDDDRDHGDDFHDHDYCDHEDELGDDDRDHDHKDNADNDHQDISIGFCNPEYHFKIRKSTF